MAPSKSIPEMSGIIFLAKIKPFLESIGWQGTPEQEQATLRVIIPLSFLAYLLLRNQSATHVNLDTNIGLYFISSFLVFALALLISTFVWKGSSHNIRIIGILGDTGALSLGLYITGATGAPWFGVYLWVTLGNGFRYGEKYLYLSTLISLIGFGCVAYYTPFWNTHSELATGLAFTLLLIPAYSAILIRRLNEARQRADAASRAKSDFLSCMSHEIRTPLNGILGMTDLLRLRPLPEEDKEFIETIHVSGHALARQINEILDLSKIEAGHMTVEIIDFDLYVLVNTTLKIFQTKALEKGLVIRSNIDPTVPYLLAGDPHKIRQIITNLVGNAMKFTHEGSITLHISCLQSDKDSTKLRFEISDTGTGIAEDKLQAIFEPFTQASDSISRNYGGTGLGTTICKNLVELMNGSIGINSTLGVGSTFWFELPFAINKPQVDPSTSNWIRQCRIIYLSALSRTEDSVLKKLEDWGVPCDVYNSIDGAYTAAISSKEHDAFIIYHTPESPLLTSINSGTDTNLPERLQLILVDDGIAVSTQPENRGELVVLHSPLEDHLLVNVLHACYSKHGTEEEIVRLTHKEIQTRQVTRQLNILVSDDNATNRIVMQRMLDKLGHRHTIVDGGEAALHALENNHFDAVIIDKNMPDMGGVEVFQAYSFAHGTNHPVEFAILTADATEEARTSCEAAGIRHFLTKPVSLDRLTESLSTMCGSTGDQPTTTAASPPEQVESGKGDNVFNESEFDKLSDLAEDDASFIREIVSNFIQETNKNIRGLESAVSRGDWLEFRDLSHALKGSALYLGLTQLSELARNAQNVSLQDFRTNGVAVVVTIRKAADTAIELINSKLDSADKKCASG